MPFDSLTLFYLSATFIGGLLVIDLLKAYALVLTFVLALVAGVLVLEVATAVEGHSETIDDKYHLTDVEKEACATDAATVLRKHLSG